MKRGHPAVKKIKHVRKECDGDVATPLTGMPFKPLDAKKLMAGRPIRPGMDDYASMPSRAGGQLVPYRR